MSDSNEEWKVTDIIGVYNPRNQVMIEHKSTKPLSQRQYDFTVNYIKNGFNAHQAALDAGYSKGFATCQTQTLITNPSIQERIGKAYQKAEKKIINTLGITFVWKMKRLKHVVEQYLPLDKDLKASDVKVGLQALSEMNKMMGDYAPDKRLNLTVDATESKMKEVRKIYEDY
jgi:phage terminase small subunit